MDIRPPTLLGLFLLMAACAGSTDDGTPAGSFVDAGTTAFDGAGAPTGADTGIGEALTNMLSQEAHALSNDKRYESHRSLELNLVTGMSKPLAALGRRRPVRSRQKAASTPACSSDSNEYARSAVASHILLSDAQVS